MIAIAKFTARFRRKPVDRNATEIAIRRLLDAWDTMLQGGWRGPAAGAVLNTGFDMLTLAFLFLSAGHGVSLLALVAGYGVPQLLGKADRYSWRRRSCGDHDGRFVRRLGCAHSDQRRCCPGLSFVFILAADTRWYRSCLILSTGNAGG